MKLNQIILNYFFKNRLYIISFTVAFVTIVSAFTLISLLQFNQYKSGIITNLHMNARLICQYSINPLLNGNHEEADQILSKLSTITFIHDATLFDADNNVFSFYNESHFHKIKSVSKNHISTHFHDNFIEAICPIYDSENFLGSVHLRAQISMLNDKIFRFAMPMASIMILAILVVLILTIKLQRLINNPISKLEQITRDVINNGKFNQSLPLDRKDKIGSLYQSFSKMLTFLAKERSEKDMVLKELRASKKRYKEIYNAPTEAILILDAGNMIILDVNQAMLDMYYYKSKDTIISKSFNQFSLGKSPYSGEEFKIFINKTLTEGPQTFDWNARRQDGTLIWVEISLKTIILDEKQRIIAIIRNISRRLKIEQDLALFSLIIEQAAEVIVVTDLNGNIKYVNPAFEKIFGYSKKEALGQNPRILKSGNHSEKFYEDMWKTLLKGQIWHGRITNKKKDGSTIEEDVTISPIFNIKQECIGYVALKRDITENQILLDQLRQSQKMEAVGTLAGGVAHDFNNILTAILGYNELLQMQVDKESPLYDGIIEIQKAGERAKDLVAQILSFSRKSKQELMPVQINYIIKEVSKLLRSSIPADITISTVLKSEKFIFADATQMHQILMNLCTNAYQAMKEKGGEIKITLIDITLDKDDVIFNLKSNLKPGNYVKLTVQDTGIGIDEQIQNKIFEPYFSTKQSDEGTGLGLAVVHGIINNYNGYINVSSVPGEGTIFNVYLPEYELQNNFDKKRETAPVELQGNEKILFVDDEQNIRNLARLSLEKHGYSLDLCINGEEGWHHFKADPKKYDIVVSDMTMPIMSGGRMAEKILKLRPDIPIIIISGYSDDINKALLDKLNIKKYMVKPIKMSDLLKSIREVLDNNIIAESLNT